MSINSLANAAAARRPDFVPVGEVPETLDQIARVSMTSATTDGHAGSRGQPPSAASSVDTAMNVLFGYIPTEILTLYVAVLAATQKENAITSANWMVFWVFLFATPAVVWLVYGAKLKAAQKPLPIKFGTLPVWEMLAATCAYVAWAFALPHSPFSEFGWYSAAVSGLVVLIVSTVLGLIAPFFQKALAI